MPPKTTMSMMQDSDQDVTRLATAYAKEQSRDVLLLSGPLDLGCEYELDAAIRSRTERAGSIVLILATLGGDPHVAYRVGRILQRRYEHIQVVVHGWCKSAGTLVAIAGHEIVIGDMGELGPIDVQRLRPDDLWERSSGLTSDAAMSELADIAWRLFRTLSLKTKSLSIGHTFKTAAEITTPLVSGMLAPVFAQMDPHQIGENARAVKIAMDYGLRLNQYSNNLKDGGMQALVSGYSSHEFVICREEAEGLLFERVSKPSREIAELCNAVGQLAGVPGDDLYLRYLNPEDEMKQQEEKQHDGNETNGTDASRPAGDHQPATSREDHRGARNVGEHEASPG